MAEERLLAYYLEFCQSLRQLQSQDSVFSVRVSVKREQLPFFSNPTLVTMKFHKTTIPELSTKFFSKITALKNWKFKVVFEKRLLIEYQ